MNFSALPRKQGLYDPSFEHDACGVALVVDMHGVRTHRIVQQGLQALRNLDHRGAAGAEPNSGDGAGILLQVPDAFLRAVVPFELPEATRSREPAYAVGIAFLPDDDDRCARAMRHTEKVVAEEGLSVLGWRDVPIRPYNDGGANLGATALDVLPRFKMLFISGGAASGAREEGVPAGRTGGGSWGSDAATATLRNDAGSDPDTALTGLALERAAFVIRKRVEHETTSSGYGAYFPSLSARTLVYKGMLTTEQLGVFYPDLTDERLTSALALVHSRFSTNTFPSWPLSHPYRYVAHNGEINTVKGNRNWMRARETLLRSDLIPGGQASRGLERIFPVVTPDASDSASFDEVVELLHLGGRSLPHAVLMMIPEAWENHAEMDPAKRAFYQFHSALMEPWDGPALLAFTDGSVIGAVLDRNGLRPGRFWVTEDGLVVLASESGVLDLDPATVIRKGRLQPGRIFLVDTVKGRIVEDDEVKRDLARAKPYEQWLRGLVHLDDLPDREAAVGDHHSVLRRQLTFGYTEEEVRILLSPMARTGLEPIGSMGTDTPIAALSKRPRLLYDYFIQLFAQVTNPPLDAIREELVTSLHGTIGPEANLLDPGPQSCRLVIVPFPVIDNDELAKIRHINADGDRPGLRAVKIQGLYAVEGGAAALADALDRVCAEASEAITSGARILVLSDRDSDDQLAPIPSLLLTAAVHHHLIREKTRTKVGLVVESGDCREVHHVALLIGYGAAAVNPYLAFETIEDLIRHDVLTGITAHQAIKNYVKAAGKGVLKVMSKMGVSTVQSYTGAQIFEAIGLSQELVDQYFTGTTSRLGGVGLDVIAAEVAARHARAYPKNPTARVHRNLEVGGEYQWRREGEVHLFNPETVFLLQHSSRTRQYDLFKEYSTKVDALAADTGTLRGLFSFQPDRQPIPVDEVESVSEIVKRFNTGAMSYGSISAEAHETLAIAMNRIGGRSNTGEGGEDPERFVPLPNGDSKRSAIKQVASGRFGVTSEFLVQSDDIQIKMAQGAKPGEGGQLPGHKVWPWIAKTRHSTPGVGLISPPPHHDIYSIEDLAQLIHDLKNANHGARIHVKLVAEVGVGTVAAGVSKAHADVVLISGHDGGTGASPLTSLKHAGAPWELGLAETQQTLLLNGLRDRIVVQVDGQMKTGRDVVIAALLGAEEYGFATAPLVVAGCVMMRVCHLDTCPVGVATQNPELRKKFSGSPDFVVNFFEFIAQEVREILAELGYRSLSEAVGHVEVLRTVEAIDHWKASGLDLSPLFESLDLPESEPRQCVTSQDHGLDRALDNTLIELSSGALEDARPVRLEMPVRNVNRTVGTMLGSEVTRRYGGSGLPDDTIDITFTGSAGQSFGAFVPHGITLRLVGDANDYLGKGLSGGRIVVRPPVEAPLIAEENIIAGNVILYGATSGEVFLRGVVGERFCVRNSGATAVVEGTGDHACEYMTGGRVVILGPTGRNLGAGMSGGIAYVLDLLPVRVNREMVDLEPLEHDDIELLRMLVERHHAETGSEVAAQLLTILEEPSGREAVAARFTKVMPRDFKRVLEATRTAERTGRPIMEAIMEAAHG